MPRTKKATFTLHEDVLAGVAQAVAGGYARSKNAFVEQALRKLLREWEQHRLRASLEQAAKDPLFMRDIQEVEAAFLSVDVETARRIA